MMLFGIRYAYFPCPNLCVRGSLTSFSPRATELCLLGILVWLCDYHCNSMPNVKIAECKLQVGALWLRKNLKPRMHLCAEQCEILAARSKRSIHEWWSSEASEKSVIAHIDDWAARWNRMPHQSWLMTIELEWAAAGKFYYVLLAGEYVDLGRGNEFGTSETQNRRLIVGENEWFGNLNATEVWFEKWNRLIAREGYLATSAMHNLSDH